MKIVKKARKDLPNFPGMCPQLSSHLEQQARIAVVVPEWDEDGRVSFGGIDGVIRGVYC
jgi:hypothetical protein